MNHATAVTSRNDARIEAALRMGILEVDVDEGHVKVLGRLAARRVNGYVVASLPGGRVAAHRCVWIAAHGRPTPGLVINHRNAVRDDNRLANLEAITPTQNVLHGLRHPGYVGTYPDDHVDPEFEAAAVALAERGNASRGEVLALLGRPEGGRTYDETTGSELAAPGIRTAKGWTDPAGVY